MKPALVIFYLLVIISIGLSGIVKFKRLSVPGRFLIIIICTTFLSESLATYLAYRMQNNTEVYHFYVIVSMWLYTLMYVYLNAKYRFKMVFTIIAIAYTVMALLNSLYYQKLNTFPSINIIVHNVIIVLYSLWHFKYLIDADPFLPIKKNTSYWLNIFVLIYFTLQLFIWGILNYLLQNQRDISVLIDFATYLSIGYYLVLAIPIRLDNGANEYGAMKKPENE